MSRRIPLVLLIVPAALVGRGLNHCRGQDPAPLVESHESNASSYLFWRDETSGYKDASLFEIAQRGNESAEPQEGPEHIRDNAFLVEEAFNQEAGEVQHIFNWIQLWDGAGAGRTRDFLFAFTMEIPLGSQAHQFSFTTQFLNAF